MMIAMQKAMYERCHCMHHYMQECTTLQIEDQECRAKGKKVNGPMKIATGL